MNRSPTTRCARFQRQIIRADYHLSDPLFSPVGASSDAPTARFYLEKDKPWRSKLIAHRVRGCFDAAVFTFSFAVMLIAFIGMMAEGTVSGDVVFVTIIVVPCLLGSAWSLMKAHSWLRWTVRNWNTRSLAPRSGKKTRKSQLRISATASHGPGAVAVGEIIQVWFISQFIRVQIKADYRPGDSTFASTATPGLPGGARQYPEEYLSSGKGYRSLMMLLQTAWLVMAVAILWVIVPSWAAEVSTGNPVTLYFYGLVVMVALRIAIQSQSFLRWMLRNWNAETQR